MKKHPIYKYLDIDFHSATPKYLQLINCTLNAINAGAVKAGDLLPSINELSFEFEISRDTVEKSYKNLKENGILGAVSGKGYYVKNSSLDKKLKILLLFNKLSEHKKIIYDSFVSHLEKYAAIDFYIYNNDFALFKAILSNKKEGYTHYVIIPHFIEGGEKANDIINSLKEGELIMLDKQIEGITKPHSTIYENFSKDIFNALLQALPQLIKYHTIKIIFPSYSYFPEEIITGLQAFCQQYAFNYEVIHDIKKENIQEGEAYINLMEDDLVVLIDKVLSSNLQLGKHVGIISYNETPLKRFLLNGITTISTDFAMMGRKAAEMIVNHSITELEVPFHLNLRASL